QLASVAAPQAASPQMAQSPPFGAPSADSIHDEIDFLVREGGFEMDALMAPASPAPSEKKRQSERARANIRAVLADAEEEESDEDMGFGLIDDMNVPILQNS